jgi:hypothetical protein
MERVLSSHRTVFEITRFWDYIYHLLYPAFVHQNELHLSLKVGQHEHVRNRDVVNLLIILQAFEDLAATYAEDEIRDSLTVRAGFFSKGDIWPRLTGKEKKRVLYVLLAASLLCGGEIGKLEAYGIALGPFKFEGVAGFIEQMVDIVHKVMEQHHGAEAIDNLQIQVPSFDTQPLDMRPTEPVNEQTIILA